MIRTKLLLFSIFLEFPFLGYSQEDYDFQRKINISQFSEWNKVEIPSNMYQNINNDFSDIRIFYSDGHQKKEIPYLITSDLSSNDFEYHQFKIINKTKTSEGTYITLETPFTNKDLENIELNFSNQNFDWKISLEGSHNQQQWFTILENYRILSIKNTDTSFQFQKLSFEKTNYKYYRIFIPIQDTPNIEWAKFKEILFQKIPNKKLIINDFTKSNDLKKKQTILTVSLENHIPISSIILNIDKLELFSRNIKIEAIKDIKTKKGWSKYYEPIYYGTILSSNIYKSLSINNNNWIKELRITIQNRDNPPLEIKSIEIIVPKHFIFFNPKYRGDYTILYGNNKSLQPQYDLEIFRNKILNSPHQEATLSQEEKLQKPKKDEQNPIFEDNFWLWGVMITLILILGYFGFRMLNQKK